MRSAALLLDVAAGPARRPRRSRCETKLVVTQDGQEIGREEFTFRPTRGRGLPGTTIIAAAPLPVHQSTTRLAATLERTPDSSLAKFQLDVESAGAVTVILAAGSGARLIVRTVAKGSESGRELPGGPDVVLLDDGVFSLYHRRGGARHTRGPHAHGDLPALGQAGARSPPGASLAPPAQPAG